MFPCLECICHTQHLRQKLCYFDEGNNCSILVFSKFVNLGTDAHCCDITVLKNDFGKPRGKLQPQLKHNKETCLALIQYSDLKQFRKSCGLWLVPAGMWLKAMDFCASSSKWWQLQQYECACCSWPWGRRMKAVSADWVNTLNLICPYTMCQKQHNDLMEFLFLFYVMVRSLIYPSVFFCLTLFLKYIIQLK